MPILDDLKARLKKHPGTVALPEAEDPRTIKAAAIMADEALFREIYLLGSEEKVTAAVEKEGISSKAVSIIDPSKSPLLEGYARELYNLRKDKMADVEQARKTMLSPLWFSNMMVRQGICDCVVSGAVHTTSDVLKASISIIKPKEGMWVSSFFLMELKDRNFGSEGILFFADGGVVPDPTPEQLAAIALETAVSFRNIMRQEPRVAMLSFSTKGSAEHPILEKVRKALEIAKSKEPGLVIDGEMQADAALVPQVGAKKAPGSPVAGKANVLIFPDLNSGNIAYKLVQRLAGANAFGPILQGLNLPASDLSRGCSENDIVAAAVIIYLLGGKC